MKVETRTLVIDSLILLRQVRDEVARDVDHTLIVSLDSAIRKLEAILREESFEKGSFREILKILGQGLAALPAIERIVRALKEL